MIISGEAWDPADAVRRGAEEDAGGDDAEGRHQRLRRGGPLHRQVAAPQTGEPRQSTLIMACRGHLGRLDISN